MLITARHTLVRFARNLAGHKDYRTVKAALDAWFHEAKQAEWKEPADVKLYYGNASIVGTDRVVFNIKGNDGTGVIWEQGGRGIAVGVKITLDSGFENLYVQ